MKEQNKISPGGSEISNASGEQQPVHLSSSDQSNLHLPGTSLVQKKLHTGAVDDPLEHEADAMADTVMRMPDNNFIQRKCANCEDEENKIQRKETSSFIQKKDAGTESTDTLNNQISQARGGGTSMDNDTRSFMETRFGTDFSGVKIHSNTESAQLSSELNARAFTNGNDIYFNEGYYQPGTSEGKHLLAHELTHTIQQGAVMHTAENRVQREVLQTKAMDQLKESLKNGNEEDAIAQMGTLGDNEKDAVLNSRDYKELAISAFGNKTMYRAMKNLHYNLYKSLEWMFDEGTSWEYVSDVIGAVGDGHDRVIIDDWMKKQFTGICNNKEMAAAVKQLGGTLLQQLSWMNEEGSDWGLVRQTIINAPEGEQRTALYDNSDMRSFFVDICNDKQMTEAVTLLGGKLNSKLKWLAAEEVSAKYYYEVIGKTPDADVKDVTADTRTRIRKDLDKDDYNRVINMIDRGLLVPGKDKQNYKEKVSEKKTDGTWYTATYDGHGEYDIDYSRTEVTVTVRIKLKGEPVPEATKQRWIAGIHNRWTGKFHMEGPRRLAIVFVPLFTDDKPHHTLKVVNEPGRREDAGTWDLNTSGDTAAHEFGHWVGNQDEYRRTAADFQSVVGRAPAAVEQQGAPRADSYSNMTDMIMRTGAGDAQIRHFRNFLNWLNSNRLPGEAAYTLVAGA